MATLRRKLPPLTGLTTFEAVARFESFTKAADELGVTQAAVSRQIHLLEEALGFSLFNRLHRRVELTAKGRALSSATSTAFNLIAETVADITPSETEGELTIAASVAFSHFWLMPRIASFSSAHPAIGLRIVSQDRAATLDGSDADLAIRYGNGIWSDGRAEMLFADEIFPVCSPEYAQRLGEIKEPSDLLGHPMITSDAHDPSWTGWHEWLAAFAIQAPKRLPGLRCSFYTEAVYAALNGQGVALGWRRLVQSFLDRNALVRLTDSSIMTRNGYFVVVAPRRSRNERLERFVEWIKADV